MNERSESISKPVVRTVEVLLAVTTTSALSSTLKVLTDFINYRGILLGVLVVVLEVVGEVEVVGDFRQVVLDFQVLCVLE